MRREFFLAGECLLENILIQTIKRLSCNPELPDQVCNPSCLLSKWNKVHPRTGHEGLERK
jgi:hypothetical protein